jgi:hypothetical protein
MGRISRWMAGILSRSASRKEIKEAVIQSGTEKNGVFMAEI